MGKVGKLLNRPVPVRLWMLVAGAVLLAVGVGAATGRDADKLRSDLADEKVAVGTANNELATARRTQSSAQDALSSLTRELAAARTILATTTTRPPTTTVPTTVPLPGIGGEGTYRVPADVEPGTYRSPGPAGSRSCYWARLSSLTGTDNIIANNIGDGPAVVTVLASDAGFRTSGCQRFVKV